MLGLLDLLHAFVEFHRFRHRSRSRVTDVVLGETARFFDEHKRRDSEIRMCASREGEKRNSDDGGGGRLNASLTRSLSGCCCVSALSQSVLPHQGLGVANVPRTLGAGWPSGVLCIYCSFRRGYADCRIAMHTKRKIKGYC